MSLLILSQGFYLLLLCSDNNTVYGTVAGYVSFVSVFC